MCLAVFARTDSMPRTFLVKRGAEGDLLVQGDTLAVIDGVQTNSRSEIIVRNDSYMCSPDSTKVDQGE